MRNDLLVTRDISDGFRETPNATFSKQPPAFCGEHPPDAAQLLVGRAWGNQGDSITEVLRVFDRPASEVVDAAKAAVSRCSVWTADGKHYRVSPLYLADPIANALTVRLTVTTRNSSSNVLLALVPAGHSDVLIEFSYTSRSALAANHPVFTGALGKAVPKASELTLPVPGG